MKKLWGNQSKSKSEIPPHSKLVPGGKMLKDVNKDLGTIEQQMDGLQQQAREAIERLHRVSGEYEQLQKAHQNLLKTAGEALQICDAALNKSFKSAQEAIESLRHALEEQGVEHFYPVVGDPVDDGECQVIADLPSYDLRPGSVARIQAPGLRLAGGKVIVRARVCQSVDPLRAKDAQSEEIHPTSDIQAQN